MKKGDVVVAKVLPSDVGQDYFHLFGLEIDFNIDLSRLKTAYRALQRETHPDRYVNASDQEKRIAMSYSALVNEAYACLTDDLKRAAYCLSLSGEDVDFEHNTAMAPDFLMQQMDWRERLAMPKAHDDATAEIQDARRDLLDAISAGFDDQADLKQLSDQVRQLAFLNKLCAE
jgi:molecular chaperone HscB